MSPPPSQSPTTIDQAAFMILSVKNIDHNERLSEETMCYAADITVDGRTVGTAENRGHGGMTMIHPVQPFDENRPIIKELEKRVDAMPPKETEWGEFGRRLHNFVDSLVSDAVDYKKYSAHFGKKTYFIAAYTLYALDTPLTEAVRKQVEEEHGEVEFLNDLEWPITMEIPPVDEAASSDASVSSEGSAPSAEGD